MADTRVEVIINALKETGAIDAVAKELEALGEKGQQAGEKAQKGAEGISAMDVAANGLSDKLKEFVGAAAIEEFFRRSITAALADEEAFRKLKFAVEATGTSWSEAKEKVDAFSEAQEAQTRFGRTETVETLARLTRTTGDLGEAMVATTLAENLASATGKELGETTQVVTMLLNGQARGLMMARREYGALVGDAHDAQSAITNLQHAVVGAAAAEESHGKSLAQTKNFLEQFMRTIGDGLLPVVEAGANSIAFMAKGWQELGIYIAMVGASAYTALDGMARAFGSILTGNIRAIPQLMAEAKSQIINIAEESARDIDLVETKYYNKSVERTNELGALKVRETEKDAAKMEQISDKLAQEFINADEGTYKAKLNLLDKEVRDAEKAGVETFMVMENGAEKQVSLAEYASKRKADIYHQETVRQGAEEKQRMAQYIAEGALEDKLLKEREAALKTSFTEIAKFSNAKNEELAAVGKAAAIAQAIMAAHEAASKAMAAFAFLGPGAIAIGAVLEAAGLAQAAQIGGVQLETGGVVPGSSDGTRATIGEKGKKEAVLPLEDPQAMAAIKKAIGTDGGAGGGDTYQFYATFNLPGAEALRDRTLLGQILDEFSDMLSERFPSAIKFALRTRDAISSNGGRSS